MKYAAATCMLLLLSLGNAIAQDGPKVQLVGGGGLAVPVAPEGFKDGWSEGYDVAGGVSVRLTNHLSVRGLVSYDRFGFDVAEVFSRAAKDFGIDPSVLGIAPSGIGGGETSLLSFSAELKVRLTREGGRVSPYVFGGGGAARVAIGDARFSLDSPVFGSIDQTVEGISETNAMTTFGGGVDFPVSERFAIFAEGRYQLTFAEGDTLGHAVFRAGIQVGL